MKRTLEWLHKYLPYIAVCAFIIMFVYMIIAIIYLKQIPEEHRTISANQFEISFGYGMQKLRYFDFGLLILSVFGLLIWLLASILGGIIYRSKFKFDPTSTSMALLAILRYITSGDSWFFG